AAVVAPQRQDPGPRLLEDALQLGHHRLGRAVDDAQILDLLLEAGVAARVDGAAGRELKKGAAVGGGAVARRRAPHRMGKAGELALHPAELLGVLARLVLVVGDVDLDQVAAILRPADIAGLQCHLVVEFPDLLGLLDRGVQRDVGIALLRGPHDRLLADHARDPDARIGLLQRHCPRVHDAVLVVRALEAEGTRLCPGLGDELGGLLEGRAGAGGPPGPVPRRSPRPAGLWRSCRSWRVLRRAGSGSPPRAADCPASRSSPSWSCPRGWRRRWWPWPACSTARSGPRSA